MNFPLGFAPLSRTLFATRLSTAGGQCAADQNDADDYRRPAGITCYGELCDAVITDKAHDHRILKPPATVLRVTPQPLTGHDYNRSVP